MSILILYLTWLKEKIEKELHLDFGNPDWQTQLGQKMWDLNQLSLGYRYGDEKVALTYRFQPLPCTPVQAFKALQCWLYQCMEGEIPELSKLYTFFDKVLAPEWAELLIMRTPEYDQAEWG
jgi:hypothetical protein